MKKFIKIIICAILSVIIQCAVLLYLDKVLLKESTEFTVENVDVAVKSVDANVAIPTNAQKVKVSYSGRYITYFDNNKLMLINTKTAQVTQILENTEILTTEWVPNNNIILVVEKASNKVNVKTYNANNGVEQPVREICPYEKNIKATAVISLSTEYISITNGDNTTIYRVDINEEMKELDDSISTLGNIKVFREKDVLFYEDSLKKIFYRYTNGKSTKLNFQNPNNLVILKAASNKIYMGEYSDNNESKNKIAKVIYGEDQTDPSTWKTETLEKPMDIKDIYINENNEIFINDSAEGKVKNITAKQNISYEGRFISVNDRVVCSSDNGKVYLKSVKDVDKTQEITKQK